MCRPPVPGPHDYLLVGGFAFGVWAARGVVGGFGWCGAVCVLVLWVLGLVVVLVWWVFCLPPPNRFGEPFSLCCGSKLSLVAAFWPLAVCPCRSCVLLQGSEALLTGERALVRRRAGWWLCGPVCWSATVTHVYVFVLR